MKHPRYQHAPTQIEQIERLIDWIVVHRRDRMQLSEALNAAGFPCFPASVGQMREEVQLFDALTIKLNELEAAAHHEKSRTPA